MILPSVDPIKALSHDQSVYMYFILDISSIEESTDTVRDRIYLAFQSDAVVGLFN